ncbi:Glyoxylate/hydroxypyruvate reductase B [Calycomorphotria hydatis]|uniref:Glyoxylate/hydroxypyruvate reductase B n=2 Tax=Calycomorphotria hydatis TaxID=2528027 RepID=A0A517TAI3_9PLAN|nr:Glyoxylate/hydroxypyruvate reductase B [Calycomorphotria hydatis]
MVMGEKPRVFVARQIPKVGIERLEELCEVDIWPGDLPPDRATLLERVQGCSGVLTMLSDTVDAELMDAAGEQLRVVANYAVGYNNINLEDAKARNVQIGNTPGVLTDATADIAFALLISAARRITESERSVRAGEWKTWEPLGFIGHDLAEKTIGIVGLGRIGQAMARRCHGGWGMNVLYSGRSAKPEAEQEFGAKRVSFDELLAESDFISVHCDLNEASKHLFDRAAFQKMKSNAIFINTARGGVHVQSDLYEALKSGEIGAAGLDVTDPEPIPMSDPLLSLENCIIIPHIGSATVSTRDQMALIAADNILAGIAGKPLRHAVS